MTSGMLSMVALERKERAIRNVGMETWRSFFYRSGCVAGVELDEKILNQASLIMKQTASWSPGNVEMKRNRLTVGWKGTPILSVSPWKLSR